jgi:hypothetical protein
LKRRGFADLEIRAFALERFVFVIRGSLAKIQRTNLLLPALKNIDCKFEWIRFLTELRTAISCGLIERYR